MTNHAVNACIVLLGLASAVGGWKLGRVERRVRRLEDEAGNS